MPPTTEKYNPFKLIMWEYQQYNLVNGVTTTISRGKLELLSQKIIIGAGKSQTGLIMKFRGTGILPQECYTRQGVICCKSEGELYAYTGIYLPLVPQYIPRFQVTGAGEYDKMVICLDASNCGTAKVCNLANAHRASIECFNQETKML